MEVLAEGDSSMAMSDPRTFSQPMTGQPFHAPTPRRTRLSRIRDADLAVLVREVDAGPTTQVLPWYYEGKVGTARLAANRAIKASALPVYVSSRSDMPGVLLFSKVALATRPLRDA
jgi:hypothetical protein